MMVNLAAGFYRLGHVTQFVVKKKNSSYLNNLPGATRLIELDTYHRDINKAAAAYLLQEKPDVLLTSKDENDLIALKARKKTGSSVRVVIRAPVNITSRLRFKRAGAVKGWMKYRRFRRLLVQADDVIAVSKGVASDISKIAGVPAGRIHVIPNPVITPELENMSKAEVDHDWLVHKDKPVLLALGRLGSQKNYELLIHAFKIVRGLLDCRLLILGEGRRRKRLEKLVRQLDLKKSVQLPGYVANPYPYFVKADLFVLSSLWEGSPNALTEALALGIPVVSTDCDSGPREILQDGKYGSLVTVGDVDGMASAIMSTLSNPPTPEFLKAAVSDYRLDASSRSYLRVLLGEE